MGQMLALGLHQVPDFLPIRCNPPTFYIKELLLYLMKMDLMSVWRGRRKVNLCAVVFHSQGSEACFQRRPSSQMRSIRTPASWKDCTGGEDGIEVVVVGSGTVWSKETTLSESSAWLKSIIASSKLGWAVDGICEIHFSESPWSFSEGPVVYFFFCSDLSGEDIVVRLSEKDSW